MTNELHKKVQPTAVVTQPIAMLAMARYSVQTNPQPTRLQKGQQTPHVLDSRVEQDALLSEISKDFAQEDDIGANINQQLADIVNKRWSSKLNDTKQKEKMDKYSRPENCEKLIVPRVNAEIWDKLSQKAKHHDLRATIRSKNR